DRRLDMILSEFGTTSGKLQQSDAFRHKLSIPKRTVLIEKRGQFARNVDSCRQTRGVKTHKRGQRVSRRRRPERMLQQQCREPHRLMAELGADCSFRGRSVIALVEQQIERPVDGRKSRRKVGRRGNVEQPLRSREQFLGTRYPLLNCSMAADEGARDLVYAEAAEDVENERDLRLLR